MNTARACALIAIRERILRGELRVGERIGEATFQRLLGSAGDGIGPLLTLLAQEGLVAEVAGHGYVIQPWSEEDVLDVIDVRGALEGLAARRVAERGATSALLTELRECLRDGDAVFERKLLGTADKARYAEMNARFHALILEESRSATLLEALSRNNRRPFASPFAIAFGRADAEQAYDILRYAHRQHYAIVDALEKGQGPRADVLMREHVTPSRDRLNIRKQRASEVPPAPESFIQAKGRIADSA
jgi:GntR family transcriptional regulator of vanillate catabolism